MAVGGAQALAIGPGQGKHSRRIIKTTLQRGDGGWSLLLVVSDHLSQQRAGRLDVGRLEDGPDAGMELLLHGFRRTTTDVGAEMHLAPLPARPLELDAHCRGEAAMVIGDDQINAGEAPAFEPGEEVHPTAL